MRAAFIALIAIGGCRSALTAPTAVGAVAPPTVVVEPDGDESLSMWESSNMSAMRWTKTAAAVSGSIWDETQESSIRSRVIASESSAASPELGGECPDDPPPLDVCASPDVQVTVGARACAKALLRARGLGSLHRDGEIRLSSKGARAAASSARAERYEEVALSGDSDLTAIAAAAMIGAIPDAGMDSTAALWCAALEAPGVSGAVALTCLSRIASGLEGSPLRPAWEGCRCGERGILVENGCLEGSSLSYPFRDAVIDERIPGALDEAISRANQELEAYGREILAIGIIGCHLPRLERGSEVRNLDRIAGPRLGFSNISTHTSGAGCDVVYAWLDDDRAFSVEAFQWTLIDPTGELQLDQGERKRLRRQVASHDGEEGGYYRDLASRLPTSIDDPLDRALVVGVVLRNAMVDAGLAVYTPVTNGTHHDHFHVHVPADPEIWREASDDATTSDRREELLASALDRASGR